jgi:F0F1-type ATP synthase assembly protein I
MAPQSPPETPEQSIGKGYKYLAAGLRFAGGIVGFLFAGLLLDRWLHTTPLFLLVGTFAGAGLGFLSVYRELMADSANRPTWKGGRRGGGAEGQ